MGRALNASAIYIQGRSRFLPARYFSQWIQTRAIIRKLEPKVIIVMQPPLLALACVATARKARSAVLIGDLHTGVFLDPKWAWGSKYVLRTLRRRGFAVVPNVELAGLCSDAGVEAYVCHGFTERTFTEESTRELLRNGEEAPVGQRDGVRDSTPHILVPLSYAFDEPVGAILDAATELPSYRFTLTGRAPASVRKQAPSNVNFSGFVSRDDYLRLRAGATAVAALTTREMTMQSAGYEALADGTPLVTSPTRVLRDFFGDAALYTGPDRQSLVAAFKQITEQGEEYRTRMIELRKERETAQVHSFDAINRRLHSEELM